MQFMRDTAPENFKMKDDDSTAFVYKQPENDEEKRHVKRHWKPARLKL